MSVYVDCAALGLIGAIACVFNRHLGFGVMIASVGLAVIFLMMDI